MKIIIKMYKNDYLNKMEYIIDNLNGVNMHNYYSIFRYVQYYRPISILV